MSFSKMAREFYELAMFNDLGERSENHTHVFHKTWASDVEKGHGRTFSTAC